MPRGKSNWTEEKFKRFIKEGRGQGTGKEYKPFWTINDFPTKGRASRLLGWKTDRIHNFFSDIEKNLFLLLDWDEQDNIIDIREHYPLLNLEEVIDNSEQLRLDKFTDKETAIPYVITTTFLVTQKDNFGRESNIAISVKGSTELSRDITIERLEIERRYWSSSKVPWSIITEKEIPKVKCKNIEWIHSTLRDCKEFGISNEERFYYKNLLKNHLINSNEEVRKIIRDFERNLNIEEGKGLYIFKYLIASKEIKINMDKEIVLDMKPKELLIEVGEVKYGTSSGG